MESPLAGAIIEDETALVDRLQSGDPEAIDEVVDAFSKPLYAFIMRLVGDSATAEDIFQETWIRVIRHIGGFRRQARFSTWLFQIALNQSRSSMRRSSSREYVALEDAPELSQDPDVDAESILRAEKVRKIVDSLPPKMREVVVLRFYNEKSEQEIAEIIDCPLGTVKSRLHRAMIFLKEKMDGFNPSEYATEAEDENEFE
ncbi:sigma-70 family RNA polymerase sigma factor [bacterium]|nr:sigma-70 family RNA polymerase sigma factor [bacterium]